MPKGYAKQVERMRKINEEKERNKEEEMKKYTGERYETQRLKKEKAPSFLKSYEQSKGKNPLLLSIQVSITPTKSGRIGIKHGDNLQKLAQNFCKAYSLGRDMEDSLVEQLQGHLESYYQMRDEKLRKSGAKKSEL